VLAGTTCKPAPDGDRVNRTGEPANQCEPLGFGGKQRPPSIGRFDDREFRYAIRASTPESALVVADNPEMDDAQASRLGESAVGILALRGAPSIG
jgi:hypothetical protein